MGTYNASSQGIIVTSPPLVLMGDLSSEQEQANTIVPSESRDFKRGYFIEVPRNYPQTPHLKIEIINIMSCKKTFQSKFVMIDKHRWVNMLAALGDDEICKECGVRKEKALEL